MSPETEPRDAESAPAPEDLTLPERPFFPHPPWTVGVVLVFGVVFLLLGALGNPLWLVGGSPFILVLLLWLAVRAVQWRRNRS